jgi:hypothetical protein
MRNSMTECVGSGRVKRLIVLFRVFLDCFAIIWYSCDEFLMTAEAILRLVFNLD